MHETPTRSLPQLIEDRAARDPGGAFLLAPGRDPLTFGRLRDQARAVAAALPALGVGRRGRVALALPDGPEMASAFLTVASASACAPLNPSYRAEEFRNYLARLGADAVVVGSGHETEARAAARALGLACLELTPRAGEPAGVFDLQRPGEPPPPAPAGEPPPTPAGPEDVAAVLQTSGTSAAPKRVPLTHANLTAAAHNIRRALALTAADRCLNVMPLHHIHGLSTLYSSLDAGGSVVCPPGFHAPRFFEWMDAFRPTWWTAAATIHRAILERAEAHRDVIARTPLRFLRSASAPMPSSLVDEIERRFGVPFIEAYGMTEASPQIASNPLPPGARKRRSAGRPAGPEVVILNGSGDPLPPGGVGEVAVRGANVVGAYEGDPAANAAAFTRGWLRTGDQGYLDDDGYLFITGRIKEVINRGGEKVSPGEVEEALADHPAVAQAVCFPVANPRLGEEVAAAVVLRPGASATGRQLREFVASRLADFKVPRQVVAVAEVPATPEGKVRRCELAGRLGLVAADQTSSGPGAGFEAPRTDVEGAVARIWAEVLGVERVGAGDDFFRLGGDSVLAVQVLARVRDALGAEVGVLPFFESPTVSGMAGHVEAARRLGPPGSSAAIPRAPRGGDLPLSSAQEGIWFADQLNPGNPVYNNYRAVRLSGPLDRAALDAALAEVVRRHEALRTTFPTRDGRPVQAVAPGPDVALAVADLAGGDGDGLGLGPDDPRLRDEVCRPFDLARGPLLRATLYRLSDREHVLTVVAHHAVTDAWSMGLILSELSAFYSASRGGRSAPTPPLPTIQAADFAAWERRRLDGPALDRLLAYWTGQLAGAPPCLDLAPGRPRPAAQSFRGAREFRLLPTPLAGAVRGLCREQGVTPFMALLAAFKAVLHAYSGQTDLVVGTHSAGRDRVETESAVGDFTNTLALRTRVTGDMSFRDLLARVRSTALGAYAHKDLPFGTLLEAVRPARPPGRSPLFQVKFRLQNVPPPAPEFAGLSATLLDLDYGMLKVDLGMELLERPEGLAGFIEYRTDLFEPATVAGVWSGFEALLAAAVARPGVPLRSLDGFHQIAETARGADMKTIETGDGSRPGPGAGSGAGSPPVRSLRGARRVAVDASPENLVRTAPLVPGQALPLVLAPAVGGVDLAAWVRAHRGRVEAALVEHGGLLFRGFGVGSPSRFEEVVGAFAADLLDYTYRSTPRSNVTEKVFTSTEYPAGQHIPLHNEMSYAASWPLKIWFGCLKAAEQGGETPLADSRKVYGRVRPEVRERFARLGVRYDRRYGEGLDLHWREVFQTSERAEVEDHCRRSGIGFRWEGPDRLRTSQVCRAVATHPRTGEAVWFNQAHLFHVSSLAPELRDALVAEFGDDLPRNAYYGDGSPIEPDALDEVRDAYDREAVVFPWQEGDVVMLDNMLIAHGRRPFVGARKVVVAMAEPYEGRPVAPRRESALPA